jgi:hypothetical protein
VTAGSTKPAASAAPPPLPLVPRAPVRARKASSKANLVVKASSKKPVVKRVCVREKVCVCVCVFVRVCARAVCISKWGPPDVLSVCVCVCERERDTETERESERKFVCA